MFEAQMGRLLVNRLFVESQKIDQQRRQRPLVEEPGRMPVAGAVPTASTTVSEQDDPACPLRESEVTLQRHFTGGHTHRPLFNCQLCGFRYWHVHFRSHGEGEGLRHVARIPLRGVFKRFDRPRFIEMEHGVELI